MASKEIRGIFAEILAEEMAKDKRIAVIDADLAKCNGTLGLRKLYPDRAFDVGIAEQNMAGIAAGMATCGMIPFISSFTPFATRRICDQIAVSIALAKCNVKIVGSDPGITAQLNGATHMSVEDVGVVRSIPSLVIYEPVDAEQFRQAMPQIINYDGPVYIRMFRKAIDDVFTAPDYKFDLFKADTIKEGKDVAIFATGIMVQETMKALKTLEELGIDAEVINIHTIKPIDREAVIASAKKTRAVVVAENHNIIGGLGSAVAEVLGEECPTIMKRIGIKDRFGQVGKLPFLQEEYEMTDKHIVEAVKEVIAKK